MEQQKEENTKIDFIFSLSSIKNPRNKHIYDFSPIQCRKTYKLIRTIPTYQPEGSVSFKTEDAAYQTKSLQLHNKSAHSLLVPKPVSHYCHICKETFEDYLKHVSHPLHIRKIKQSDRSLSIDSLKKILENRKMTHEQQAQLCDLSGSFNCSNQTHQKSSQTSLEDGNCSFGSKKRIIVKQSGSIESVSVSNITEYDEEGKQLNVIKRRGKKRYSRFRQLN